MRRQYGTRQQLLRLDRLRWRPKYSRQLFLQRFVTAARLLFDATLWSIEMMAYAATARHAASFL